MILAECARVAQKYLVNEHGFLNVKGFGGVSPVILFTALVN